jgi:hydrogenase expression/formation protein HypD
MKYLDEYRQAESVNQFANAIKKLVTRPWNVMEICGGQTHSIVKYGLDQLLPEGVNLIHGPGCPVCVTPIEQIDKACEIARRPGVIFCSFGDMLRVPGSRRDLFFAKSEGADVRVVYSPLDALKIARDNPGHQVVFFAVGFETTAPANAMAVAQAQRDHTPNFSILTAQVLVPPAMKAILGAPDNRVQGFLAAGHVCAIMGFEEYEPIARQYKVPVVVTGFEPLDIMEGLWMCLKQLEEGRTEVENQYTRVVKREGNPKAQEIIRQVFVVGPRKWRGVGEIPFSGLSLAPAYLGYDAERRFKVQDIVAEESLECLSGQVLKGVIKPMQCPAFGKKCTPENPLGAPMVSGEGACAAYYRYRNSGMSDKG